ncbi:hypothetical protein GCM10009552_27820 [Rothia nasimurium]|uniref:Uncharacterized protein n=1 Tax=Tistrella bauzanensis TaxID=657419 RepID=A0ABQ1IAM5_9PROT|nr:hypothetical protein GCM10011505_12090 [Tistrella bauzanensis]GJB80518.1 hypothetical protein KAM380_049830 [Aeromonas caviae]
MHHPQRGNGMPRGGKRIDAWLRVVEGAGLGGPQVNRAQSSDGSTMTVAQRCESVTMRMASPGWIT